MFYYDKWAFSLTIERGGESLFWGLFIFGILNVVLGLAFGFEGLSSIELFRVVQERDARDGEKSY